MVDLLSGNILHKYKIIIKKKRIREDIMNHNLGVIPDLLKSSKCFCKHIFLENELLDHNDIPLVRRIRHTARETI